MPGWPSWRRVSWSEPLAGYLCVRQPAVVRVSVASAIPVAGLAGPFEHLG
jgi:hypothetical protein